jgi:hypothetical protein
MWDAVSQTFVSFSEPLAGKVLWMHQDERRLVSIGIGNLVDPVEHAVALPERGAPYYDKYGPAPPVTEAQIRADWDRVKHDPVLMGNWRAVSGCRASRPDSFGSLELDQEALQQTVERAALDRGERAE